MSTPMMNAGGAVMGLPLAFPFFPCFFPFLNAPASSECASNGGPRRGRAPPRHVSSRASIASVSGNGVSREPSSTTAPTAAASCEGNALGPGGPQASCGAPQRPKMLSPFERMSGVALPLDAPGGVQGPIERVGSSLRPAAPVPAPATAAAATLARAVSATRAKTARTFSAEGNGPSAAAFKPVFGVSPAVTAAPTADRVSSGEKVPLPHLDGGSVVMVSRRRYDAILRRRQQREKSASLGASPSGRCRKPFLHLSRHNHALRRVRGSHGRFLKAAEAKLLQPAFGRSASDATSALSDVSSQGAAPAFHTGPRAPAAPAAAVLPHPALALPLSLAALPWQLLQLPLLQPQPLPVAVPNLGPARAQQGPPQPQTVPLPAGRPGGLGLTLVRSPSALSALRAELEAVLAEDTQLALEEAGLGGGADMDMDTDDSGSCGCAADLDLQEGSGEASGAEEHENEAEAEAEAHTEVGPGLQEALCRSRSQRLSGSGMAPAPMAVRV
ncbi:hypothetical protein HYH03_010066 [Edaphochlamys debaryana]|uniref:Nuclear transcription factor Y subunit n=1 Tax=Edaphochlamys debaryana TaxID=47281 RepID=A0A835XXN3_9CHLO|nr:hypothetical protein HYH03_010066 [Edaphochlamys debaryana]|eukprot:KAG2491699.1 hypothetical protein HYH03_010066 [Edaphochlamys debaryana]